jgi:protein-S-isoprenylcysteine O-methyltransferase Ste14
MNTLAVYLASTALLLVLSTLTFRVVVRNDYMSKGRLTPLSIFMETLIFFMLGGFPYVYGIQGWPEVKIGFILEILGWFLLGAGLLVIIIGMMQLGLRIIFGQGSQNLKQNGLYSYSRNPQILGCWLYVVGFTVQWPSWYTLGWACLFGIVTHMMVLTEEEYLYQVFRQEYHHYIDNVPRYLSLRVVLKKLSQYRRDDVG